nr:hypothetical protein [Candidatus Cloacimonadota bacterium]
MNYKKNIILIVTLIVLIWLGLNAEIGDIDTSGLMYRVSLVGAIDHPGVYLVAPSTRVSEVLQMEKLLEPVPGNLDNNQNSNIPIPPQVYSIRNIVLKRNNTEIAIDLEKYNILGDMNHN